MPQHKSAKKRMKTSARDRQRNRAVKSHIRRALKSLSKAMEEGDSQEQLRQAHSVLDKAAKQGVIHTSQANRRKARLAKAANKATAAAASK